MKFAHPDIRRRRRPGHRPSLTPLRLARALARLFPALLIAALPALAQAQAQAHEIHVAVAANFLGTLQKLAPRFEHVSGDRLVLSAGSSGLLMTQIAQGAPFDVFLSADAARPKRLEDQGLALADSRVTYAIGTLVLWSPKPGAIHPGGGNLSALHLVAIANPDQAPYGTAAREVLTALGQWQTMNASHRIVSGESITQTWQFAESGNVDAAFVALSQVIGTDGRIDGSYWLPPQTMYAPIDQDAVILTHSTRRDAARVFLQWLHASADARAVLRAAGYRVDR